MINPREKTEKAQRYRDQGWENLEQNPAYPVIRKYRDTVFKEKLLAGDIANRQQAEFEHTIDLEDDAE